jgi:hypothetical protein
MFNIFKDTRLLDAEVQLKILEANPPKINHILHLLLSVVTGGLWVIVWLWVGMSTSSQVTYTKQIVKLENYIDRLKLEKVIA